MTFFLSWVIKKIIDKDVGGWTFQSDCKVGLPKTTTKKKMVMVVVVSWRGLHKYRRFCCFWYYIYGDHLPPVNEQVDFYDWKNRWSDGGTESDVDEHSICSNSPFDPKFKFKERLSSLPNGYRTVLLFVSAKLNKLKSDCKN